MRLYRVDTICYLRPIMGMTNAKIRWRNARLLVAECGEQVKFARLMQMSESQAGQIVGDRPVRNIGPRIARRIEATFHKPEGWLDIPHAHSDSMLTAAEQNVSPQEFGQPVPVVSWVQAGAMNDVEDPFHPGEAEEWVRAVHSHPGSRAFALRVEGDSMTSPYGISFPSGSTIIVDPDASPDPGRFVIAKDIVSQKATFKRLAHDGGRWFLQPLNPAFPTIEIDEPALRVVGVVVEYHVGGRV